MAELLVGGVDKAGGPRSRQSHPGSLESGVTLHLGPLFAQQPSKRSKHWSVELWPFALLLVSAASCLGMRSWDEQESRESLQTGCNPLFGMFLQPKKERCQDAKDKNGQGLAGRVLLSPSELHARQIARPESPAAGVPKCTWLLDDPVADGRELKRGPTEGPKQTRDLAPAFAALVELNFEASSTLPSGAP